MARRIPSLLWRAGFVALAAGAALAQSAPPVIKPLPAPTPPAKAAAAPAPAPGAPTAKAAGLVPAESMQGVDWSGLTPEQKTLAVSILNDSSCTCGCGMKLAVCRRDDPTCPKSPGLAKQVVDLVRQGKTRAEVLKALPSAPPPPAPAPKFIQFTLPPGDAPAVGPKTAPVTILHYLDYQ